MVSSFMSLCVDTVSGGPGSEEFTGIGKGTSRIVYSKSGGERSSMGNMVDKIVRSVVRVGPKRARRDRCCALGDELSAKING
jgi:hypothetical protein